MVKRLLIINVLIFNKKYINGVLIYLTTSQNSPSLPHPDADSRLPGSPVLPW